MGREASITQEEVNAAADQIRASGKKPTARAVRELLGRGNMATILRYLKVWEGGQFRPPDMPFVLPQALHNALIDFISQEVASAKVVLETDLATSQQENADLMAESERQALAIERNQQEIESLVATQAELNGRMNQLTADLEISRKEAEEQRQAAEQARTEQAKLQLRLESLPQRESDIKGLKETLETERAARVKSEQDAAVAFAKLEKTEAQIQDLQGRLARAEAEATQEELEAERIARAKSEQDAAVAFAKLEKTEAQVQDLQSRLAKAETEAAQAGDRANALWEQLVGAKASVT